MRLRHIPGCEAAIQQSPYVIDDTFGLRGRFREYIKKDPSARLCAEIGMGKGRFITGMAKEHPDVAFIGIERSPSVLLRAAQLLETDPFPPKNLALICGNAKNLAEIFAEGEISRLYLNFSDPWPKDRHAKRRLTAPGFLDIYSRVLAADGALEFKTDNEGLFDFSVESFSSNGWKLLALTRDLHRDPKLCSGNIMTEYEDRFSKAGHPIFKLIACK